MQRPPIQPKSAAPSIGRTRASDAQKLLTQQNKIASIKPLNLGRTIGANSAYAFGASLSHQVRVRGSEHLKKSEGKNARVLPYVAGSGFALLSPLFLLGGANGLFVAAAAVMLFASGHTIARSLQNRRFLVLLESEIDLAGQFDRFAAQTISRLPYEAVTLLQEIRISLSHLLPRLGNIKQDGSLSAEDVFFIEQTILRYLPDISGLYLAIPADRHHLVLNDRNCTPTQALMEQFGMLAAKLKRLHDELVKIDADRLTVHQRFLADRISR